MGRTRWGTARGGPRRWRLVTQCQCRHGSLWVKPQAGTLSFPELEGAKLGGVFVDPRSCDAKAVREPRSVDQSGFFPTMCKQLYHAFSDYLD